MDPTLRPGELVAQKYRLRAPLGQGGMGTVWSAENALTGRQFAIKILHSLVSSADDTRHRFLQEARASAKIDHPNVIDIFDFGHTEDGGLFLVMELLDGLSLSEVLRCQPPLSARELCAIVAQAATGLAAAHAVGVIHRDVKPANIFLHRDRATGGVVTKVVDFGVSKLAMGDDGVATTTGSLLGSPRYMSPEQAISASSADARSDLWSLGVLLFEALSGVFPHEGDSSNNLIVAIATTPPRSIHQAAPQLPAQLRELVEACLRPQAERIGSARELAERCLDLLSTHDLSDIPLKRSLAHRGAAIPRPSDFFVDTSPAALELVRRRLGRAAEVRQVAMGEQRHASAAALAVVEEPSSVIMLDSIDVASVSALESRASARPTLEPEEATRMLAVPLPSASRAPLPGPGSGVGSPARGPDPSLAPRLIPPGPSSFRGPRAHAGQVQPAVALPEVQLAPPPPFSAPPAQPAVPPAPSFGFDSPQARAMSPAFLPPGTVDPSDSVSSVNVVHTGGHRIDPALYAAQAPRPKRWPVAVGLGLLAGLAVAAVSAVVVVASGPRSAAPAGESARAAQGELPASTAVVGSLPSPEAPSEVARIDDAEVEAELARLAASASASAAVSAAPSVPPPASSAAGTKPPVATTLPLQAGGATTSRPAAPAPPKPKPKPAIDEFGSGL